MEELREWICREAEVLGPEFLRVDGILNHRIDPKFIALVGEQLAARFCQAEATCVLTAEAAGNIVAYELARRLGISALYAKKGKASTMIHPLVRMVVSPTKGTNTELAISADYLCVQDRIIVVDDFLYQGHTSAALADMMIEAGARLVGFVIEKTFANGRDALQRFGVPIETLAPIESMNQEQGTIMFAEHEPTVLAEDRS